MTSAATEVPIPDAVGARPAEPRGESKAEASPAPNAAQQRQGPAGGSEKKPRRGGQHKGKHMIEIPENAERDIGVVVSHQDKVSCRSLVPLLWGGMLATAMHLECSHMHFCKLAGLLTGLALASRSHSCS
jgi:hypothetical protein